MLESGHSEYEVAGWWQRVGASVLNALIVILPTVILVAIIGVLLASSFKSTSLGGLAGVVVAFVAYFLTYPLVAQSHRLGAIRLRPGAVAEFAPKLRTRSSC